jgi:HSP20 family molecular chaperone IbpA
MDTIEKTVPAATEEQTANRELTRQPDRYAVPPVDIYETADGLVVLADLPGVTKDGLSVQVEQGVLTIEGRQGGHIRRPAAPRVRPGTVLPPVPHR